MINHLKAIHRRLYLPRMQDSTETSFKVTPIAEPYLYTDPNLYVDRFDNPNPSVKVSVSNVGDGELEVERIRIPRVSNRWVKRGKKLTPTVLTATSEPLEIEIKLPLKALPNPSTVNSAELNLISNSKRKTFSKVLLSVGPSEAPSPNLTVPEYINFGEITVWNISITSHQEDETTQTVDFSLVGNFRHNPPIRLEITQKDEFSFEAIFLFQGGKLHYTLDVRTPGIVMPHRKKDGLKLKSFRKTVSMGNVDQHNFSGQITSDTDWLVAPREIALEPYSTTKVPVSVTVGKLKPGRNCGQLIVSDQIIPIWAWYKISGATELTVNRDQSDLHHVVEFPKQGKTLPIEVAQTHIPHQSVMIFEDLNFEFPLTRADQFGYLLGDFNQWEPHALLLEKRPNERFSKSLGLTLSIPDGTYLFRAEIDGEMRLDPGRLHEIICCSHGLASKIQIERHKQQITLRNKSKQKLELQVQVPMEWMQVDSDTVSLPSDRERKIPAVLLPAALQPGLNLGWLALEGTGESTRVLRVPIFVMGMTSGAVPVLQKSEIEFPKFEQGKTTAAPLGLKIFGKGVLRGDIQPSTVLRFAEGNLRVQNDSASDSIELAPSVRVLGDRQSNAYRKQCNAWFVTDCYLANRRVLPFTAKYDMIHLIADPPVLYFPKVFLFDEPQQAAITVRRSDGTPVECPVDIPEQLAQNGLLQVKDRTGENETWHCAFVLNPQSLTTAKRISDVIHLKDEKSGMTLPIRFGTEIVQSRVEIQLESPKQLSRPSDGIPLVLTNVGETEMKIFEVQFKSGKFYCTPHLSPHQLLSSGESLELLLKVRKQFGFFRRRVVRDTLMIRLSDPQFPNGLFEKEIAAEVQGIF